MCLTALLLIKAARYSITEVLTERLMPKLAYFSRRIMAAAASLLPSPQNLQRTRMLLQTSTKLSRAYPSTAALQSIIHFRVVGQYRGPRIEVLQALISSQHMGRCS